MTETNIKVRDIGPVVEFSYDLSGYGLHVLRGNQGAGKTTILRVVDLALNPSADIRPAKRDGAPRGEATVDGKKIRVMKNIREEGELTSIFGTGNLSIADLHSPAFKTAVTRDRHRITTLTRLAGVKADASLFHGLLGGRKAFEEIVPVDSLNTDDLVEMAGRVKRSIERAAIDIEGKARTATAEARAHAAVAEATPIDGEHDADKLQNALEAAIKRSAVEKAKLDALSEAHRKAKVAQQTADEARARLASLGGGMTVAEAQRIRDDRATDLDANRRHLETIRAQLREAEADVSLSETQYKAAGIALQQAKREEELHAELHAAIDAANVPGPTDEEIDRQLDIAGDAGLEVETAKSAVTAGVKMRQALEARERSDKAHEAAKELEERARRLRDAATDTADVLTEAIAKLNDCPLKIALNDDGEARLVLSTDRSDAEPFDELSDGERWIHVVRIAAQNNRLIVLPQSAFGELSPSSRRQIHELAVAHECYILTAVAEDCELRGEAFQP